MGASLSGKNTTIKTALPQATGRSDIHLTVIRFHARFYHTFHQRGMPL
jgi:hypothetical protein